MKEKIISAVMRAMGRKGGKKRMEAMTPAERTDLAKKAAAKSAKLRSARKRAGKG